MTYDPTAPNAQDSPRDQTTQVRTNFSQFATIFAKIIAGVKYNHTALNNIKQGDHESVLFKKQTTDRGVTDTLDVVYCKDASSNLGTQPQLFLQIPKFLPNINDTTNAQNTPMQLTYNSVNMAGPVYQSFLVGGYLIYFGTVNATGVITLAPAGTKILMAIATPNQLTSNIPSLVSTQILNNSQFQIFSNAVGLFSFTWIAVATV